MNEPFVKVDLHGLRQEEAIRVIDRALASAGPMTYQLQLIHGYHRGTSLRSMIYCGWTTDLEKRLATHNSGHGAKYTRSRRPLVLVYAEEHEDRHEALSREWHIKRMSREEKMKLVKGRND